jgi:hypothetical protein
MAIAALTISIVSALVAAFGLWYVRRSAAAAERGATAAEGTERSATIQAEATRAQAAAGEKQLVIDRERFHQELTPVLEGSVRRRPSWRGGPPNTDRILEVRVSKGLPLARLTLHLPAGTYIGRSRSVPSIMAHDLSYPEVGSPTIGPGHPATWDVVVGKDAPASFTATADCRDEYGKQWFDVEVLVKREND